MVRLILGLKLVRKRLYIGLAVLGLVLIAGFLGAKRQPEPVVYRGKPVRVWAMQMGAGQAEREEAAAALKQLGTNAVPELVRMLGTRDSFLRIGLWRLQSKLPAQAQKILARMVRPPAAARTRGLAARSLVVIGPEAESAVPALYDALEDESYEVRDPAAASLSKLAPAVLPLMTNGLQSSDGPTRRRAARAVGLVRPPGVPLRPLVLALLRSPDPADRLQGVLTLMKMGMPNPAMVRAYVGAVKDPDAQVRLAAVHALSMTGLQAGISLPGLTNALADAMPAVRESAAQILGNFGARAQPALAKLRQMAVGDEEGSVQLAAKQAVARIETPEVK